MAIARDKFWIFGVRAHQDDGWIGTNYAQRRHYQLRTSRITPTEAAHMLARGEFGKMVALQNGQAVGVPLEDVAGKIKKVQLDNHLLIASREVGTCFGD